ncbi:MAG: 2-keto-4-methylthiobutyrate aminotransferase [Gemmatimonadetes bacterium]|nr:2-keto-4-methylthiobutyrate aminotransferase [Gemmatimonadota bacterium]
MRQAAPGTEAWIPSDDRGMLLGDGLFETVRLYRGRAFRLDAHLDRLAHGAGVVGIPVPGELRSRVDEALVSWKGRDGALRITLTRGSGFGLAPPEKASGRLLIGIRPVEGRDEPASLVGLRAVLRGRVDERALISGLKTIGYLERIQAVRLAHSAGAEEALLRNSADLVVEGSASNLIAVVGGLLVAPGLPQGALAGITRAVILDEATGMGVQVEERGLRVEELDGASELLLTSSVREIVPIIRLEGRAIGSGGPGPFFRALSDRFRERVERELAPTHPR